MTGFIPQLLRLTMIRTLAIDTSSKTASVALLQDEVILYELSVNVGLNHSVILMPAIDRMLRLAGLDVEDIDLFACTSGPGSFTGLRIAAGTIKGFAMASNKPIVGVSSLDALSLNAACSSYLICPLLDARKGQVYTALYRPGEGGFPRKITADKVAGIESVLNEVNEMGNVIFLGDGAAVYRDLIDRAMGAQAVFLPAAHHSIRASAVGLLGLRSFEEGKLVDSVSLIPHYLRLSEAEMKGAPYPA